MGTIGIVGVTGNAGSRIAGMLVGGDHEVIGIARDPSGAPDGVVQVSADLRDADAARDALGGIDALYLPLPESGDDPLESETAVGRNVIEAASANGIDHVVMHTAVHGDRGDTGVRILDNKASIEDALKRSGLGYTILRPAWYFQNLWAGKEYLAQGMFSLPWPDDMAWAGTDVQDLAGVAVAILQGEPTGRGFDLHVPGGISAADICDAAEAATGTAVQYQEAPSSREAVEAYPISEFHKELYAELYDYFQEVPYLGQPREIESVLPDFSYSSVEDFMRRELFAGS